MCKSTEVIESCVIEVSPEHITLIPVAVYRPHSGCVGGINDLLTIYILVIAQSVHNKIIIIAFDLDIDMLSVQASSRLDHMWINVDRGK